MTVGLQEVETPGICRQPAHTGGKVVRRTQRPSLPSGDIPQSTSEP